MLNVKMWTQMFRSFDVPQKRDIAANNGRLGLSGIAAQAQPERYGAGIHNRAV